MVIDTWSDALSCPASATCRARAIRKASTWYPKTVWPIFQYCIMGVKCFTAPQPVFSSILYVHVSEMPCTFHRSCALFTSPLVMFVFHCIGATKHVLPCIIYIRIYIYIFFIMMLYGSWWVIWPKNCVNHPTTDQPYKLGEKFDQFEKY